MRSSQEVLALEKTLLKLENLHASFDYLRISIASPSRIKSWAQRTLPTGEIIGEVLRPETINFRTHQPEVYGLFCEKIFGPIKSWKCRCGKYNGFALDKICEECEVEITESRVRRYRMGYIELTCPITHLWYLKGMPNYLSILLKCFDPKISASQIEQVVYFKEGSRIISSTNPLFRFFYKSIPTQPSQLKKFYLRKSKAEKRKGSEIIKAALESLNISLEIKSARAIIDRGSLFNGPKNFTPDKEIIRRIRILESFLSTKSDPQWMVLTTLPVLAPNLRPLVELENGRLVAADVNEIYRLILTRNQRLADFLYRFLAPDLISVQGRKLLQESVDSLIDNSRLPKSKTFCLNNKPLKSLTEVLEGKQGRFRQSLLGKRVDYSGRSVIIVGPNLRLNQCGMPYGMASELFQPYLINELLKTKIKPPSHNNKLAHIIIKKSKPFIWRLLEKLTKKYCVLLNRAPTLHRFGIQSFDPVMILGQAIHLHPLVCTGFNADFDGDQMAVHLPLYEASQLEAKRIMRPSYNALSPSNGDVILKPTQDMVIGCYYLTILSPKIDRQISNWFGNEKAALLSFYQKNINLHTSILVRYPISEFKIKLINNEIIVYDSFFDNTEKKLKIFKKFKSKKIHKKFYFLTNIGVLIANDVENKNYKITNLFLETTAGRIIFSSNLKTILTKHSV